MYIWSILSLFGSKNTFFAFDGEGGGWRKVVGKHLIKSLIFVYLWVRLPELYFPILTLKGDLGFEMTFFCSYISEDHLVISFAFFWSGMAPNGQERPIWTQKFVRA